MTRAPIQTLPKRYTPTVRGIIAWVMDYRRANGGDAPAGLTLTTDALTALDQDARVFGGKELYERSRAAALEHGAWLMIAGVPISGEADPCYGLRRV